MNQNDVLALLRANPHHTIAELADIVAKDRDSLTISSTKSNIAIKLYKLLKKGDVVRSDTYPARWSTRD